MANHASALKAHRQSVKRRMRNRSNRTYLHTALKRFSAQIETGEVEKAKASISNLYSTIDKSAKKQAISKNAAARRKSRLTRHLNVLVARANKE